MEQSAATATGSRPQGSRLQQVLSSHWCVCLLLALMTLAAFWPVLRADFINYDDPDYVTDNPQVLAGLTGQGVAWAFTTFHASNWHPLTWLSHMLDATLFGTGPRGPHAVNLALHIFNSALVFLWLRSLTGAPWRSALVAGLFALHPIHVESVAWVAERKDVLCAAFGILCLWSYTVYARRSAAGAGRTARPYALAVLWLLLGLMSKPMLVTWPFVMLLLDVWPLGRLRPGPNSPAPLRVMARQLVLEKLPFFLLSAGSCVATALAQQKAMQPLQRLGLVDRAENAAVAGARYLAKIFWPAHLALPYPYPGDWPPALVLSALLLLTLMAGGSWLARRRFSFLLTGTLWFLGTLVPVIGLVQVGIQSMADRYLYLPSIGLFIVLAWGLAEISSRLQVPVATRWTTAGLLVAACALVTHRQAGFWSDSETLFRHAVAATRGNYHALNNLGVSRFDRGKTEDAISYYQQALAISPNYPEALNNLGAALAARNDPVQDPEVWFRRALSADPAHVNALFNLGNTLTRRGHDGEAVEFYQKALQIAPDRHEARNNLASALAKLGRNQEALDQYRLAARARPDIAKIRKNLAGCLFREGHVDEAAKEYRTLLKQSPDDADAHYALGQILATQGGWEEAIIHYQRALQLAPGNPETEYNLGYALRMRGQLTAAVQHFQAALQLRPEFPIAHFNLACVLAEQGQTNPAIAHLEKALSLKPDYREAEARLRKLGGRPAAGEK